MTLLALTLTLSLARGLAQVEARSFCEVIKDPKSFQSKPIRIEATADILYGGILLNAEQCPGPDVSVHFMKDYERESDAAAMALLERLQRQVRQAHAVGGGATTEQATVGLVLEGRLEKNPFYHVEMSRGDKTVAAWDYQYEYAFVLTRVVSLRPRK